MGVFLIFTYYDTSGFFVQERRYFGALVVICNYAARGASGAGSGVSLVFTFSPGPCKGCGSGLGVGGHCFPPSAPFFSSCGCGIAKSPPVIVLEQI